MINDGNNSSSPNLSQEKDLMARKVVVVSNKDRLLRAHLGGLNMDIASQMDVMTTIEQKILASPWAAQFSKMKRDESFCETKLFQAIEALR